MEERLKLWNQLSGFETDATVRLRAVLEPLEPALAILHDLGNWLTEMPGEWDRGDHHILVAGGLIKRALDDLRAAWSLLNLGYTAAAGAAAADLWEHAMLASWVAVQPEAALRFQEDTFADKRFGAWKLAEAVARLIPAGTLPAMPPKEEIEHSARQMYSGYQMLCQLKHPTYRALRHTSSSTVSGDGELGLMAFPNTRDDDAELKKLVIVIAHGVLDSALLYFAVALKIDETSAVWDEWLSARDESYCVIQAHFTPAEVRLPFTIGDSATARRLRDFRSVSDQGANG